MARPIHAATWRTCVAAWLLVWVVLAAAVPAAAQTDTAVPAAAQTEAAVPAAAQTDTAPAAAQADAAPAAGSAPTGVDLEALVKTLEDDAERAKFVATLKDLIAAQQAADADDAQPALAQLLSVITEKVDQASQWVIDTAAFFANVPSHIDTVVDEVTNPRKRARWLEVIVKLAIVLGVAFAVDWGVRALLSGPRRRLEARQPAGWASRLGYLVVLTVINLVPILAFAASANIVLPLTEPKVVTRLVAIALVNANVLARLILLVMDLLLASRAPALRLHGMSDTIASGLLRWSRRLTNVGVFGYFGLQAALLLGLPRGFYLLLMDLLSLVIVVMLVLMIIQYRAPLAAWMRGPQSTLPTTFEVWPILRRRLAEVWHLLAIAYVIAVYLVSAFGVSGSLAFLVKGTVLTVVIIVVAGLISVAVNHLIEVAVAGPEDRDAAPGQARTPPRYLGIVEWVVSLLVSAGAILALLSVWGVDVGAMLASDAGQRIISSLVKILTVLGIAMLVFAALSRTIERYLTATDEAGQTVERSARERTMLPLAYKAAVALLFVMATFITLSELGIDITPLIAGAGVFGIAIGFGAQSLVRDVISGFFILMEDTFVVGDVVDVGGNAGVVEAISHRTVKLRDLSGTLHTIPFGDVTRIKNLTKDFSYYLLNVGVAYRENVDQVMQVLRELGAELQEDVAFKFSILEPIEILGVDAFADSAVVIKARIKTRPIRQWAVGREFNRRMKNRFDELGIEIPFPHHTVYFGVDKHGDAPAANLRVRVPAGSRRAPATVPPAPQPQPTTMSDPPASATLAAAPVQRTDAGPGRGNA